MTEIIFGVIIALGLWQIAKIGAWNLFYAEYYDDPAWRHRLVGVLMLVFVVVTLFGLCT